jgi:hypothetical protein
MNKQKIPGLLPSLAALKFAFLIGKGCIKGKESLAGRTGIRRGF